MEASNNDEEYVTIQISRHTLRGVLKRRITGISRNIVHVVDHLGNVFVGKEIKTVRRPC